MKSGLVRFLIFAVVWWITFAQLSGDFQMNLEREEPCFFSDQRDAFQFGWPGAVALVPIVGQVMALGWGVSLLAAEHSWPTPRFFGVDAIAAHKVCQHEE